MSKFIVNKSMVLASLWDGNPNIWENLPESNILVEAHDESCLNICNGYLELLVGRNRTVLYKDEYLVKVEKGKYFKVPRDSFEQLFLLVEEKISPVFVERLGNVAQAMAAIGTGFGKQAIEAAKEFEEKAAIAAKKSTMSLEEAIYNGAQNVQAFNMEEHPNCKHTIEVTHMGDTERSFIEDEEVMFQGKDIDIANEKEKTDTLDKSKAIFFKEEKEICQKDCSTCRFGKWYRDKKSGKKPSKPKTKMCHDCEDGCDYEYWQLAIECFTCTNLKDGCMLGCINMENYQVKEELR